MLVRSTKSVIEAVFNNNIKYLYFNEDFSEKVPILHTETMFLHEEEPVLHTEKYNGIYDLYEVRTVGFFERSLIYMDTPRNVWIATGAESGLDIRSFFKVFGKNDYVCAIGIGYCEKRENVFSIIKYGDNSYYNNGFMSVNEVEREYF